MSRSEEWFQRALRVTPGGVHSPVRSLKHVAGTPVFFSYGEGAYLHDVDGRPYVDFCMSFGPHILGHSPAPVTRVLREQVAKATSFGACHPKEVELSEKLLAAYPFLDKARLVNSGTEAVMTALRLARAATDRPKILKFEGCYHGHSDAMLAKAGSGVSHLGESSSRGVGSSQVADTITVRLDDPAALDRALAAEGSRIAAVILEPIPANSGLWVPPRARLEQIVAAARAVGALVIFDEVITGFRVGPAGACGMFDLQPDLVTLGKIVGGGLPLAAVLGTAAVMDQLAPLGQVYQAGTLSGNPIATAAGCAVLDELAQNPPYAQLQSETSRFVTELESLLKSRYPARIEQLGSIFWIHFSADDRSFPVAISADAAAAYGDLFRRALSAGVYLPPSPYEVAFVSTGHFGRPLEAALEKLAQCIK